MTDPKQMQEVKTHHFAFKSSNDPKAKVLSVPKNLAGGISARTVREQAQRELLTVCFLVYTIVCTIQLLDNMFTHHN
jgi:hypothetical protein